MCEINSIRRVCEPTAPGLVSMFLIGVDDIVSIPYANDDWIIEEDIIMRPYKYFKQIFFREQKAGLADELQDAVGGGFKKNIGLFIPRYGNTSNKWIYDMIGTRFIMLVQDMNNQIILVGNQTAPMRMEKALGNTGQKIGDENGWTVAITAESNRPCYLYTGLIITENNVPPVIISTALLMNDVPNYLNVDDALHHHVLLYQ
jgi:hypothetical protein